jgi:hypothetical protein
MSHPGESSNGSAGPAHGHGHGPGPSVRDLPDEVDRDLGFGTGVGADGDPDDAAADGRTAFDGPGSEDGLVRALIPQRSLPRWRTQALARIESDDGRTYVAQVVAGPFAAPAGLPAEAPALVVAQAEGVLLTPPYYGYADLSIRGELRDGAVTVPLHRPRPNSRVRLLDEEATRAALDCDGDVRLGKAVGFEGVAVGLRSSEKHHLPRHTLVVGTTGSGKSTLVAGLVERLTAVGFCVLLLDVEGEYSAVHRPADSARLLPALRQWGLEPAGLRHVVRLLPPGAPDRSERSERSERRGGVPPHPPTRRFCLRFEDVSPEVAVELMQANEAQAERFRIAYDAAAELYGETLPDAERRLHRAAVQEWDDQVCGCPGLRLAHVLDAASALAGVAAKEDGGPDPARLHDEGFRAEAEALRRKAASLAKRVHNAPSWFKTVGLLGALHRSRLFDQAGRDADGNGVGPLGYAAMLGRERDGRGRALVFDLSGVESPEHRNLAIAGVLRGVSAAQDALYAAAAARAGAGAGAGAGDAEAAGDTTGADGGGPALPKTVVVIEEAHEFVSAERIRQMPALYAQVQRIARRGRKRWLGLLFATQFPQHLPAELFGLCNNRVLLRLGDEPTVERLRRSVGGVPESLWTRLRNLPPGQAVVSAHGLDPALLVALEPGRCKLLMTD